MISAGLSYKTYRETRTMGLSFAGGLLVFQMILAAVLPMFGEQAAGMLQMPFVRTLISAMLGMDFSDEIAGEALASFAWVHPAVLILIWTQVTVFAARLPAGEIGRGTIDQVLAMPISRWTIFRTQTLMGLAWGVLMFLGGVLGAKLGAWWFEETGLPNGTLAAVAVNLFCLYVAVGGMALGAAGLFNSRSNALGLVFAVLVATLTLNFLSQLWEPAKNLRYICLLYYYRPMTFIGGGMPWGDLAVLCGFGTACWYLGGRCFANKDIPAR